MGSILPSSWDLRMVTTLGVGLGTDLLTWMIKVARQGQPEQGALMVWQG